MDYVLWQHGKFYIAMKQGGIIETSHTHIRAARFPKHLADKVADHLTRLGHGGWIAYEYDEAVLSRLLP